VPSVGDVLRGRRRENTSPLKSPEGERRGPIKEMENVSPRKGVNNPSPRKDMNNTGSRKDMNNLSPRKEQTSASPLGERHINSPPQPQRLPTKQEDGSRPPMHKKTNSSVSLRGLLMGRQSEDEGSRGREASASPKKVKSSTNLTSLLKKRSKKDLNESSRNQGIVSPTRPSRVPEPTPAPLWQQFATQPQDRGNGVVQYPASKRNTLQEEIDLYTPRDYSEFRPAEQRNFGGYAPAPVGSDFQPPQRPFLAHKNSNSSIFSEHLDEEVPEIQRPKSRDRSASRPSSSRKEACPSKGSPEKTKRSSRVLDAITTFNLRSKESAPPTPTLERSLSPQELNSAFEKVLDARNIPHNMRDTMRNLKPEVKEALMRGERSGSGESSSASTAERAGRSPAKKEGDLVKTEDGEGKRARSRSRTRSRILTLTKRDAPESPTKEDKKGSSLRSRSKTRPKSVDMSATRPGSARSLGSSGSVTSLVSGDSATTPGDFIHYLREVQKPSLVEVGKLHKLRILLRNESVTWTDTFVTKGGMNELVQLLYRISKVEWREEHEDNLLHETLLCLKALCTTELAMQRFEKIEEEFFPCLLAMLFDPEKKGPSEYNTRSVIISLLYAHLCAARGQGETKLQARAERVLGFLRDPKPEEGKSTLDFVSQMHISRPYRVWSKEVTNVTKEVFWIFLHHLNVVPIVENSNTGLSYAEKHFPAPRPPHPAAPYVGGVEWEATQYLATHLDLMNGLIASLPSLQTRNQLRNELKQSGFEKVMGGSLRTCKEKFYGGVHDGLKVWVAAGWEDGWVVEDVRAGPPRESASPVKSSNSPVKKKGDVAPVLALDVGLGGNGTGKEDGDADAWL
jgi:hypothetical protein